MKHHLIVISAIVSLFCSHFVLAGGRIGGENLMDLFLQKSSTGAQGLSTLQSLSTPPTDTIASDGLSPVLVFQPDSTTEIMEFEKQFSLTNTLTAIRNSSGTTTTTTNSDLLKSMLDTLSATSRTNGSVAMLVQNREDEVASKILQTLLNGMKPTALFNRFDLAASDGSNCGEYRVIYAKKEHTTFKRFFLIFEARYPNPKPIMGRAGCFAVADFWGGLGNLSRDEALDKLQKFFYEGITHRDVQLPAAIKFAHYTKGAGQLRSNQFIQGPWQLREFKTAINAEGTPVFVADTVKSNPLAELFAADKDSDTKALKDLRENFSGDFDEYLDNLLAPELVAIDNSLLDEIDDTMIINGFHLGNDDRYNEFQSNSAFSDNTTQFGNLNSPIGDKLSELGLLTPKEGVSSPQTYTVNMIKNRAEAMSCGGCHQNNNIKKLIAPGVVWPSSGSSDKNNGRPHNLSFVHVDEEGILSDALIDQFLPRRVAVLEDYLLEFDLSDTDKDGIPDNYEISNDLDPLDPSDVTKDKDNDGFSNLEEYQFNSLANDSSSIPLYQTAYVEGVNTITPGENLIPIFYDTSDDNSALSGLGLRVHFNADELEFTSIANTFSDNLVSNVTNIVAEADINDFDKDPDTTHYITVSWDDSTNNNWPGQSLPTKLFDFNFSALTTLAENDTIPINFSSLDVAGYDFKQQPRMLILDLTPFTLDIDGDSLALAGSDGILIFRFLFGSTNIDNFDTVTNDATRNGQAILDYLTANQALLDIDDDGQALSGSDGILIFRYLLGYTDPNNFDTVTLSAKRTGQAIVDYLKSIDVSD